MPVSEARRTRIMARMVFAVALGVSFAIAASAAGEGLGIEILTPPTNGCRRAKSGDSIKIHYDGKLADGTRFDSSYERDEPLPFTLGKSMVIKGMEDGLLGACIGEVRELIIPPGMGYGDRGAGGAIPGGATLKFKVEITEIEGAAAGDEL